MHDRVDSPIEEAVLGLESADPEGTRQIMSSAALIRLGETSKTGVFISRKTLTAPFSARDSQKIINVPFVPIRNKYKVQHTHTHPKKKTP